MYTFLFAISVEYIIDRPFSPEKRFGFIWKLKEGFLSYLFYQMKQRNVFSSGTWEEVMSLHLVAKHNPIGLIELHYFIMGIIDERKVVSYYSDSDGMYVAGIKILHLLFKFCSFCIYKILASWDEFCWRNTCGIYISWCCVTGWKIWKNVNVLLIAVWNKYLTQKIKITKRKHFNIFEMVCWQHRDWSYITERNRKEDALPHIWWPKF